MQPSWQHQLSSEMEQPYFQELLHFLDGEKDRLCPPESLIFNAFWQTPFDQVKIVLMGQDPYHGKGQAEGLCFSVPSGVPLPPSLRNIYLELERDLKIPPSKEGSLLPWAKQGVLLLNATLTVRLGAPKSHYGKGWERFTDAVVHRLMEREDPLIFLLWGNSAQEKISSVKAPHVALSAAHPSPFSAHRGFFGCHHFSKVNALLERWGKTPIDWRVCNSQMK
jgi:uracil-DNA glycosylase